MEVHYELMSYGIPTTVLPLNTEGVVDLGYHNKWLEQRLQLEAAKRKESASPKSAVHKIPYPHDVLFGRDKMAQQHPGNTRYMNLIESTQDRYDTAPTKASRTLIATEIVVAIKSNGGLFLKHDGIGWIEAGDVTAKEKVTNAFRSRRRKSTTIKQTTAESVRSSTSQNKRRNSSDVEGMDDSHEEADDAMGPSRRKKDVTGRGLLLLG
jgi:DNA polymerase II small subunit/DNA polymerase delta subunit B